jgi:large subunit ribosomal protein L13
MQQTTLINESKINRSWYHASAKGKVLGALAVQVAEALMGRKKRDFTPHTDNGDFVVVTEVEGLVFTGRKAERKLYAFHTGYFGGLTEIPLGVLHASKPEKVFELAVRRMLPKNVQAKQMMKRLKVYKGGSHPHTSQAPKPLV